jgi:hypothetical protein
MKFESWNVAPVEAKMYRWLAVADFNADGCVDVVVTALNEAAMILENPCGWRRK